MHKFPDKEVTRNYKVKERHVTDYIKANIAYTHVQPVFDRMIDSTACGSGRRPDVFFDLHTNVLFIEIDENQHGAYDTTCENKRIMQLFLDVGSRPVVLMRFNPDAYISDKVKHKSLFDYTPVTGVCKVRNKREFERRCNLLMDAIHKQFRFAEQNNIPNQELTIIKLFYDDV